MTQATPDTTRALLNERSRVLTRMRILQDELLEWDRLLTACTLPLLVTSLKRAGVFYDPNDLYVVEKGECSHPENLLRKHVCESGRSDNWTCVFCKEYP